MSLTVNVCTMSDTGTSGTGLGRVHLQRVRERHITHTVRGAGYQGGI